MYNIDIHHYDGKIISILKKIRNNELDWHDGKNKKSIKIDLSLKNQKLLLSFIEYCEADGISKPSILKYINAINLLLVHLKKDLDTITKDDLRGLFASMARGEIKNTLGKNYAPESIRCIKITVRGLMKFLGKEDVGKSIEARRPVLNFRVSRNDLWTREDMNLLIDTADNPRDKAIIALLSYSGCRIAEIMGLKIKDISFDKDGDLIIAYLGKTGQGSICIAHERNYPIECIKGWLEVHPFKDNPENNLWCKFKSNKTDENRYINEVPCYNSLDKSIRRIYNISGIKKPFFFHILRHSDTTCKLQEGFNIAMLKKQRGWKLSSNMIDRYAQLVDSDHWKEEKRVSKELNNLKDTVPASKYEELNAKYNRLQKSIDEIILPRIEFLTTETAEANAIIKHLKRNPELVAEIW